MDWGHPMLEGIREEDIRIVQSGEGYILLILDSGSGCWMTAHTPVGPVRQQLCMLVNDQSSQRLDAITIKKRNETYTNALS